MSTLKVDTIRDGGAGFNDVVTFANSVGTENGRLCRAFVNFNGQGVVAARASFNVNSITDNGGTGDYTVNFANAMADANYAVTQCCAQDSGGVPSNDNNPNFQPHTYATGSIRGLTAYTDVKVDCVFVNVAIFR